MRLFSIRVGLKYNLIFTKIEPIVFPGINKVIYLLSYRKSTYQTV